MISNRKVFLGICIMLCTCSHSALHATPSSITAPKFRHSIDFCPMSPLFRIGASKNDSLPNEVFILMNLYV